MTSAVQALSEWFSQFNLPVYLNSDVPDEAELPYITIPLSFPEYDKKASFAIQIWYRTRTNVELLAKADEIVAAVGSGVRIETDYGCVVLYPDTPLVQVLVDGDYRSAYINLSLNSYQMPGV